jgi:uncharacterized oligopeptide transporter (OPT) family protein
MFLILIGIQACLLIYANPTPENTAVWDFIWNVDNWNSTIFILALIGIAAGIGLVGIAASAVFGFKTDFLILAPAIAGLISMGVVFINLANVMRDELIQRVFPTCSVDASGCTAVTLVVGLLVGTIAFYYVWTVIEWWRGRDF